MAHRSRLAITSLFTAPRTSPASAAPPPARTALRPAPAGRPEHAACGAAQPHRPARERDAEARGAEPAGSANAQRPSNGRHETGSPRRSTSAGDRARLTPRHALLRRQVGLGIRAASEPCPNCWADSSMALVGGQRLESVSSSTVRETAPSPVAAEHRRADLAHDLGVHHVLWLVRHQPRRRHERVEEAPAPRRRAAARAGPTPASRAGA